MLVPWPTPANILRAISERVAAYFAGPDITFTAEPGSTFELPDAPQRPLPPEQDCVRMQEILPYAPNRWRDRDDTGQ